MLTFTLDTNCLIDVEEDRPDKQFVLRLLAASQTGAISLAILASSASERQIGGGQLDSFKRFNLRMQDLGFGSIRLLLPIFRFGTTYLDNALWGDESMIAREQQIFETLFPTFETDWAKYANANGIDAENLTCPLAWKWRNRLCDAQAYWAHEHHGQAHFVTRDPNFHNKLTPEAGFPDASVLTPLQAAQLAS